MLSDLGLGSDAEADPGETSDAEDEQEQDSAGEEGDDADQDAGGDEQSTESRVEEAQDDADAAEVLEDAHDEEADGVDELDVQRLLAQAVHGDGRRPAVAQSKLLRQQSTHSRHGKGLRCVHDDL